MEVKYRINTDKNYGEIFNDIVEFSADYIMKNNLRSAILGISGGIDSTVVAAILHETTKRIHEINMEYDFAFYGYTLPTETTNSKELHIARMVGFAFTDATPRFVEHNITDIAGKIKVTFGIGTNLTCDMPGIKPMNIVMKLKECRINDRQPIYGCVKLSDVPGKAIGKSSDINCYKYQLGIN